jgi:hypothetical protein
MNYEVTWPGPIRRRILEFYARTMQGTGRETAELNVALAEIEEALQRTPVRAGESRNGGRRVIIVSPLSVEYVVNENARHVTVIRVHYSRGKRS